MPTYNAFHFANLTVVTWRRPVANYTGVKVSYCRQCNSNVTVSPCQCQNHTIDDTGQRSAVLDVPHVGNYTYVLYVLKQGETMSATTQFTAVELVPRSEFMLYTKSLPTQRG